MRRSSLLLALLLILAACGTTETGGETTTEAPTSTESSVTTTTEPPPTTTTAASGTTNVESDFPVTVEADNGTVTIEEMPDSIVSLSATATEMLFAVGADDLVTAVDDQSNYPEEAPTTDLSSFTPNVEAILGYEPDLVIISYDPGELVDSLEEAGVPVIFFNAAETLEDAYYQIEALGSLTGQVADATIVNETIENDINKMVEEAPDVPEGTTYYHEVDNTFYTATSSTFIGRIYAEFGLENIADPADEDGSAAGYPQLSSEYIVSENPDLIFLANTRSGESAETVADRPGWDAMSAIQEGNVTGLDSDIVSRWGPRIVEFAGSVSDALGAYIGDQG